MSNLHEECGIFGIFSENRQNVAETVYYGLFALQHRGQESCGIVVNDDGIFRQGQRPCPRGLHPARAGKPGTGKYVHRTRPLQHYRCQ